MMSIVALLILSILQYSSGISIASISTKTTGNNAITLEQYQQVQLGWTRDQVTQFVGSPGTVVPSGTDPNIILVQYRGPSSNIVAVAGFSFMNGILSTKGQYNFDF